MPPTTTPTLELPRTPREPGRPAGGGPGRGGSGDGSAVPSVSPARIGVWLLVGAITILFAAFTSTYLVRRNAGDWPAVFLPPVLWLTTAVLLISSLTMEAARRAAGRGTKAPLRRWLGVTTFLGLLFLGGQLVAWRQLAASGLFMATNPHSAFFYLLTGAHGVHLAGGIGALIFALVKAPAALTRTEALDVTDPVATYWHFLDGLWLYLFLMLYGI
jgi:cytochrome c oxidase subunit 3